MINLDDSIFEESQSQFEIKSFDERILSESIFDRSLSLQLEFEEEVRQATVNFYRALQEKADLRSTVTVFKSTIQHTMRMYIEKSRREVNEFSKAFEKKIEDDKAIINPHLSRLRTYISDTPLPHVLYESEDTMYEYTYIMEDKVPNVKYMDTFIEKNIDLEAIDGYKGYTEYKKLEMIEHDYNELVDYIKSGQCYSYARGFILNKKETPISAEKYSNELFKIYRNGGDVLPPHVTAGHVKKAIERFDKYTKAIANIRDDFDPFTTNRMKVVMDQLDKLDMIHAKKYFSNNDDSFEKWYSMYIALKNEQLLRLISIHHHCMNAKLDALIRSYIQDRNILVKAIGINNAQDEFIAENFDPYDYAGFLIEEQFNAIDMFIEATKITGLNESVTLEVLDEAVLDNLKNFLIGIGEKISETIGKFLDRVSELFSNSGKFLGANENKIKSDFIVKDVTLSNYYSYDNLITKLGTLTFKPTTAAELETQAENDRWQTAEDYRKTALNIPGFVYKEDGDSFKDQLSNFLRGQKQDIKSETINKEIRTSMFNFILKEFPTIKEAINKDKATVKSFGREMDTYIATKKNNSNATVTSTVTQASSITTGETTQSTNSAFTYQDTIDTYFNEVEIKQNKDPGDSGVQKSFNKDEPNKKDDIIKKMSAASKSYVKVNTDKLTIKMNILVEAQKQDMKILKWYVNQYNKNQKENKKNEKENNKNNENKSIAGSIK